VGKTRHRGRKTSIVSITGLEGTQKVAVKKERGPCWRYGRATLSLLIPQGTAHLTAEISTSTKGSLNHESEIGYRGMTGKRDPALNRRNWWSKGTFETTQRFECRVS